MSFLDKLWKRSDSDDYDDEYEDYEEDEEEDDDDYEEPVRKPLFFKRKEKDYDYDLEEPSEAKEVSKTASSKITSIARRRTGGNSIMNVCVIKPTTYDDAKEITETLRSGKAVILNFEGLDIELAQRIIDFICGVCTAIDGNLRKISHCIFIVTPKDVDISGDFQDLPTDVFDGTEIKTDF